MVDWHPGISPDTLVTRARFLASIRQFFAARNVLEVETPLLNSTTATDVYIESFQVLDHAAPEATCYFLHTSPEFGMKRLLAAGSGPIFQLCKVFRSGESSRIHNPEFTMLEWYRPAFTMFDLIDEVEQLVNHLLQCGSITRLSYKELFEQHLSIDPHRIDLDELSELARSKIEFHSKDLDRNDYLQLLLARVIEPDMPDYCFVYDFPVAQAALAKIEQDSQGQLVARRFELFAKGMEIANGYFELTDADEQHKRFISDNTRRKALNLAQYPIDEKLLAALSSGMPTCAGVAVGVDRLLMLLTGASNISEVIGFSTDTI